MGDDHALGGDAAGGLAQVLIHAPANAQCGALQLLGRSDGEDDIAGVQDGVRTGEADLRLIAAADAGNDHAIVAKSGDVANRHAVEVRVFDAQRRALRFADALGELLLEVEQLLFWIDAEKHADQDDDEDDAEHAEGIGDGVGHRRATAGVGIAGAGHRLLRRAQRGRVGGGAGEDAGQHARLPLEDQRAEHEHDSRAAHHDQHGQCVEFEPIFFERVEKSGPQLQSDGEHKQRESELLEKRHQVRIERQPEMPEQQPAEQHARHAELDAADADAADQQAEDRRERDHQDRLRVWRHLADSIEKFLHAADAARVVPRRQCL